VENFVKKYQIISHKLQFSSRKIFSCTLYTIVTLTVIKITVWSLCTEKKNILKVQNLHQLKQHVTSVITASQWWQWHDNSHVSMMHLIQQQKIYCNHTTSHQSMLKGLIAANCTCI